MSLGRHANNNLFQQMHYETGNLFPGTVVKLAFKKHSKLCLLINFIFRLFTKDNNFRDRLWTTFKNIIYIPNDFLENDKYLSHWILFAHELGHVCQSIRLTFPLYAFLYLWPASGGILLLLTCWIPLLVISNIFWSYLIFSLWVITSIIFLTPLVPAYWRTRFELECYCISAYLENKYVRILDVSYIDKIVKLLSGKYYYYGCRRNKARKLVKRHITSLLITNTHSIRQHPVVRMVEEINKQRK